MFTIDTSDGEIRAASEPLAAALAELLATRPEPEADPAALTDSLGTFAA